jgi:hypothetical protein
LTKFRVVLESIRESLAPAAATFAERCVRALAFPALMRPYEIFAAGMEKTNAASREAVKHFGIGSRPQ